jgi:hypothetical protein
VEVEEQMVPQEVKVEVEEVVVVGLELYGTVTELQMGKCC